MELGRYTINIGAQVSFRPPTGAEWLLARHNLGAAKKGEDKEKRAVVAS